MPAYGSGLSAQIGFGAELTTAVGTAVTPTRFYEFLDESLMFEPTWLESEGLKAGQAYKRGARTVVSRVQVSGDVSMEMVDRAGMGLLWKHALGSIATAVQIGTSGAYQQVHTAGSKATLSLTGQVGRPQIDATVKPFCVDEQTEILTQRGWITHHSLEAGDLVLSLDPAARRIVWDEVLSVHRFDHDGPLVRWKSQKIDALTTPNHRWLVEASRGRESRPRLDACPECGATSGKNGPFPTQAAISTHRAKAHGVRASDDKTPRKSVFRGSPVFRTTEELATRFDYIILGGGDPSCFAPAPVYSDEFVELIGWVVTEGHYQAGSHSVVLAQDIVVNPEYTTRIRRLAAHFKADGATVSEYVYGDDSKAHWYFGKGIGRTIRTVAPQRQMTPEFLCALTVDQARLLFRTLIDGDGTRRAPRNSKGIRRGGGRDNESWAQKDAGRIDGFQMLAAMLGRRTWSHPAPVSGCSTVAVHQDNHSVGKTMPKAEEDYLGVVWCPRTRTNTWLARRNGCTYWTGNTYTGLKIPSWEFSVSDGEIAKLKLTFDGWNESTAIALTTAGYDASAIPFTFRDASTFTLGGTVSTTAGVTSVTGGVAVATVVKGFTLSGETPMANERFGLGNAGVKKEQIENGIPTLTGSLDAEFYSQAELYDVFKAATSTALQLDLAHGTAGTGQAFRISIILPAVKLKKANVNVNGPDIVPQKIDFEAYDDGTNPPIQVRIVSTDTTL